MLGNDDVKATTVGEIIPTVEFYDFDAKYNDNSTKLRIPADIPEETIEEIRAYAIKAFKALDGSGLSRVDFFVKHSDGVKRDKFAPGLYEYKHVPEIVERGGDRVW